jgi:dipeptide transport system substrate-binding protein
VDTGKAGIRRLQVWVLALPLFLAATGAYAKTLVFCSEGDPGTLNPQVASTKTGMNAGRPIFNNLVEYTPGTTDLTPALAESLSISRDGMEYTFHLREGVKFHSSKAFAPTREMNADDVIFSLLRQWKEEHPFHDVSGGNYYYFEDAGLPELLKSIDKIDEYTVRIRLNRPEAPFLADLAMPFGVIQSAEYAEQLLRAGEPEKLDKEPIGTGPFVFAAYLKDVAVRYRAFDDYWAGRQSIDNLVFSITPSASVRLLKLKSGECHVASHPTPADREKIATDAKLKLLERPGFNISYLALTTTNPPLDDVRVRRAVNMAVDKLAIVEAILGGAGVVAKNPIPPTLWSFDPEVMDYAYDPEAARSLMLEAGWADGFDAELWYAPTSEPYNPNPKRVAEMIQADLAKVAIRVHLTSLVDWAQYRTRLEDGAVSMTLSGWTGDSGDPDNFLYLLLGCRAGQAGGNNLARWCNGEYEEFVTRAKVTTDRATREKLYRRAQEIFHDEAPWVPLAHSEVFMATRANVTGFSVDPLGRHLFQGVTLDQ